jgi:hypothetical protein
MTFASYGFYFRKVAEGYNKTLLASAPVRQQASEHNT